MSKPIVAVVGRPNVGKSALVNRIAQADDAIVHEKRGVTRDRSYHDADWNGREFMLVDTGGIEMGEEDAFQNSIRSQALMAIEEASVILFMVDGAVGITSDDQEIARILKRSKVPVILVVNKLDDPAHEEAIWEFYSLGLGDPHPVSALHGYGTGDLLDEVADVLPDDTDSNADERDTIDVAIIGRPNAGKSSLTNRLCGSERTIVSDVAGTTRDAIDSIVERNDTRYRIVDTAGIRRKSQISEDVEYYGIVRALRAIDRANVVLLVVDASLGLTDQDQHVAVLAKEHGCAMVILLNKWDLLETQEERDQLNDMIEDRLVFVDYAPRIAISALTGRGVERIWDAIDSVYANYTSRISTSRINNLMTELRDFGHTVSKGNRRLKIHYATQATTRPPTFTFFANHPELIDDTYRRYLENRIRDAFPLEGTPIRMHFKRKDQ